VVRGLIYFVRLGYCFFLFMLCHTVHNTTACLFIGFVCFTLTSLPLDHPHLGPDHSKDWWRRMCQSLDRQQVPSNLSVRYPRAQYSGEWAWKAICNRLQTPYYLSRVDHVQKIRDRKQRTCIRKYSFVDRTIKNWNQLSAEALGTFPCNLHF